MSARTDEIFAALAVKMPNCTWVAELKQHIAELESRGRTRKIGRRRRRL